MCNKHNHSKLVVLLIVLNVANILIRWPFIAQQETSCRIKSKSTLNASDMKTMNILKYEEWTIISIFFIIGKTDLPFSHILGYADKKKTKKSFKIKMPQMVLSDSAEWPSWVPERAD